MYLVDALECDVPGCQVWFFDDGYFYGSIDEVKIYNRTFSAQEVSDLHASY